MPIVLGFVANVLTASLKGMRLGMPNSILGAVVSALKYVVILSCVLNVMQSLHILNQEKAESSTLLGPVTGALRACFDHDDAANGGQQVQPADSAATAQPDTVWVDMTKKKN